MLEVTSVWGSHIHCVDGTRQNKSCITVHFDGWEMGGGDGIRTVRDGWLGLRKNLSAGAGSEGGLGENRSGKQKDWTQNSSAWKEEQLWELILW